MTRAVVLLLCVCLAPLALAQDGARVAGTIELTDGDVLLEGRDGRTRAPVNGESVFEGDTVTTFPNGEIHLHMADGAAIIVRENSRITIAEYVAEGGDSDRSLIDLAKGALRSITGWIGQYNRSNYRIRTPLVTIGVRGTDHEPSHLLEGDARGEPGSYDKVNEGRTYMQSPQGTIEVPVNRVVFRPQARGARARLLATAPAFFKPGRFERRFEGRAREVRSTIVERRQARREILRQRGGPGLKERPQRQRLEQRRDQRLEQRRDQRPEQRRERRRSARDQRQ